MWWCLGVCAIWTHAFEVFLIAGVYANHNLRLAKISVYGFDYDYTLAHYTELLQHLIYNLAKEQLVTEVISSELNWQTWCNVESIANFSILSEPYILSCLDPFFPQEESYTELSFSWYQPVSKLSKNVMYSIRGGILANRMEFFESMVADSRTETT